MQLRDTENDYFLLSVYKGCEKDKGHHKDIWMPDTRAIKRRLALLYSAWKQRRPQVLQALGEMQPNETVFSKEGPQVTQGYHVLKQ